MALSFKEKRALQQEIQACFSSLEKNPGFKEKRSLQKQLAEAFAKLEEKAVKLTQSLYEQLVAGKFLKEAPLRFLVILKNVLAEIGGDVKKLHDPVIDYFKAHRNEEGVFESAGEDVSAFGHFLGIQEKKPFATAVRHKSKGIEYGDAMDIIIDIDTDFESPETFREIIRAIENAREKDTVILKINSHGGRTDSAQAVYAALLETKARTIARVITAYSSGSIVAMSCDEIQTTPHCTMMIHNASSGTWGKIGDIKAQTSFLEEHFKRWFAELYAGFLSTEEIADVFKGQDIWLSELDIKKRLPNWKPIRIRRAAEAQANNAEV